MGRTALQSALLGRRDENAISLLKAGATLVGSELAIAIALQRDVVVDELLTKGASFEETSTISDTISVLEAVVLTEDMALISQIIKDSSQTVVASPLWAAIFVAQLTSDRSIFKFLLGHVTVTSQSEDLWLGTAMYLAAMSGDLEIVELMLKSGLRPEKCWNARCINTDSIIHGGNNVRREYILWRYDIPTILTGEYEEEDLLESALNVADVNIHSKGLDFLILLRQYGYHRTVRYSPEFRSCPSLENLEMLKSFGVEMTSRTLSDSIRERRYDTTEWLLASGVDVNLASEDLGAGIAMTPVQEASLQGNLPLVEKLKNLGADINAPAAPYGATALQYASIGGYFGLVRRLLEFQADPNAWGSWSGGRTALEGAAEHGKLDVVQLLLNSGVKTIGGGRLQYVRAIRFAQDEGHHAVARLIKSHRPWEEADQRLYDVKSLLADGWAYEPSGETYKAEVEASGVPCDVSGGKFKVDDEKGVDSNTDLNKDGWFSECPSLLLNDIEDGLAYGVDDRAECPGDAIWREAYETFSSELPWLMEEGDCLQ
ncbi:hypothetical protein CGRA01v4_00148 [Colletotrichum graminicola]|uniref:Uncharacterized protein n=1 Tax=Colletotrichum graminicola (strain M1.001 / M2 / FGSC 10212) TaxID=645133 RepID=E3QU91_COLGM|nr:uncharacterized protein GLRG_09573 [Colletotrichum graminicola M1.001]EFQ34429.1 hypothetical protein GLRG_09573 [Colletotrichum graminicola M1.001]WDK08870.1 hypothetical protein CGRA01v4_00148 [Colletotrichum graminicola]